MEFHTSQNWEESCSYLRAEEFGEVWGNVEGDSVEGSFQSEPPDDHAGDDHVGEQGSEVDDLARHPDALEDAQEAGDPHEEQTTRQVQHYVSRVVHSRGIVLAENSPPINASVDPGLVQCESYWKKYSRTIRKKIP